MTTNDSEVKNAFFAIAHCSVALDILDDVIDRDHPCRTIVKSQQVEREAFQLPEPWVGHIESSQILFIASNPSIGDDKHALRSSSPTDVWNSHVNLFDEGAGYTRNGIYTVLPGGERSPNWVRHWAFVRSQATILLCRRAVPGKDFALSEVVHCKSLDEFGVSECARFCTDRHFGRVLSASRCRLIVSMGGHANRELRRFFRLADHVVYEKLSPTRRIVFVPHSNFRGPRTLEKVIPEYLDDLRQFLRET